MSSLPNATRCNRGRETECVNISTRSSFYLILKSSMLHEIIGIGNLTLITPNVKGSS